MGTEPPSRPSDLEAWLQSAPREHPADEGAPSGFEAFGWFHDGLRMGFSAPLNENELVFVVTALAEWANILPGLAEGLLEEVVIASPGLCDDSDERLLYEWVEDRPYSLPVGPVPLGCYDLDWSNVSTWADPHGTVHVLEYMGDTYRANVIRYLTERTVEFWSSAASLELASATLPQVAAITLGVKFICQEEPRAWLESTPLMRRLRDLNPSHP